MPIGKSNHYKQLSDAAWKLGALLQNYVRNREVLSHLRSSGYLSSLTSDHELAYQAAIATSNDEDINRYFDFILSQELPEENLGK